MIEFRQKGMDKLLAAGGVITAGLVASWFFWRGYFGWFGIDRSYDAFQPGAAFLISLFAAVVWIAFDVLRPALTETQRARTLLAFSLFYPLSVATIIVLSLSISNTLGNVLLIYFMAGGVHLAFLVRGYLKRRQVRDRKTMMRSISSSKDWRALAIWGFVFLLPALMTFAGAVIAFDQLTYSVVIPKSCAIISLDRRQALCAQFRSNQVLTGRIFVLVGPPTLNETKTVRFRSGLARPSWRYAATLH